jgi:predicted RNA-binding Zn-ribbon protein involved in translation (DUF1610 family)
MAASNWALATAPPCPKCAAENTGRQHHIQREPDGSWSCSACGHGWK